MELLSREHFAQSDPAKLERYRVRLVDTKSVPLLQRLEHIVGKEAVLIDLPQAEGIELKELEAEREREQLANMPIAQEADKENEAPPGCEVYSEALEVNLWTLSTLEKASGMREEKAEKFCFLVPGEHSAFDAHLLPATEAIAFANKLALNAAFATDLEKSGYWLLADASGAQRTVLVGCRKDQKTVTTYRARSLGTLDASLDELRTLSVSLSGFSLLRVQNCVRYEVIAPVSIVSGGHGFIPARLAVHATWSVPAQGQPHTPDFLSKPHLQSVAKITFSPGWLDRRIEHYQRSQELKFLLTMCDFLEAGACRWPEEKEQTDVVEKVMDVIDAERRRQKTELLDFTEQLWAALRECRAHATLHKALDLVYDEINGGGFSAVVHPGSQSSLARLLRARDPSERVMPRLEPLTCVQMLVEVGLDRLRRDLETLFTADGLVASAEDLRPFLPQQQPSRRVEHCIRGLLVVHLALQSVQTLRKHVHLQPNELHALSRRLLEHFHHTKRDDIFRAEFVFDATVSIIDETALLPSNIVEWSVEKTYLKKGSELSLAGAVREFVLLSVRPVFEHLAPYTTQKSDISESFNGGERVSTTPKPKSFDRSRLQSEDVKADPSAYHCVHVLASTSKKH